MATTPWHRVVGWLAATDAGWPNLVLRLSLAVVIFPHGAQKLLGAFGGGGFGGSMAFFTDTLGIPYVFGVLAIAAEFFGPIALAFGFMSRIAAFGVGTVMTVAWLTVHLPNGFFMNWYGTQAGEGFEYHLLAIGMAAAITIGGSGRWSLDRRLGQAGER